MLSNIDVFMLSYTLMEDNIFIRSIKNISKFSNVSFEIMNKMLDRVSSISVQLYLTGFSVYIHLTSKQLIRSGPIFVRQKSKDLIKKCRILVIFKSTNLNKILQKFVFFYKEIDLKCNS